MNENKNYTYPNNESYNEAAESSSFDYKMWIIRIVKSWYLFAISLVLFMSFAYLKNRSWRPSYKSSALVIIEDSKGYLGAQATLLQGFGATRRLLHTRSFPYYKLIQTISNQDYIIICFSNGIF